MILSTTLSSRDIKKHINALLKSRLATSIKKIKYIKDYTLAADGKAVSKQEEQILSIFHDPDKKEKVLAMITKLFPQGSFQILPFTI